VDIVDTVGSVVGVVVLGAGAGVITVVDASVLTVEGFTTFLVTTVSLTNFSVTTFFPLLSITVVTSYLRSREVVGVEVVVCAKLYTLRTTDPSLCVTVWVSVLLLLATVAAPVEITVDTVL
jgi:hypothetical protein